MSTLSIHQPVIPQYLVIEIEVLSQSQRSNQYQLSATDSDIKRRQQRSREIGIGEFKMSEIKRKSMVSENYLKATIRRAENESVDEDVPVLGENGSHDIMALVTAAVAETL